MLFKDFQTEVKRRIVRSNLSGEEFVESIKRMVNNGIRSVCLESNWKDLRGEATITTIDGQASYILPEDFGEIAFVWHRILGYNHRLTKIPKVSFVDGTFEGTTEGTPYWYMLWNTQGVEDQPVAASAISFVSSDSGDTTQKIRIEGLVSSKRDSETITLDGTGTVSTTKSFSKIYKISVNEATDGRITVTAGAVTIATLPANLIVQTVRRKFIEFYYEPDADDESIFVHYYKKHINLVNDLDAPALSEEFDELILYRAMKIGLAYEELSMDVAKIADYDYKKELRKLKQANMRDNDWLPILNSFSLPKQRGLNFGSGYPYVRR